MSGVVIELSGKGGTALVSECDAARVARIKWFLHSQGYDVGYDKERYAELLDAGLSSSKARNRSLVLLHRFIMEPPDGLVVDHINHDRLDCQRENMRVVPQNENMQNRSKVLRDGFSSRYRGVAKDARPGRGCFMVYFGKAYIGTRRDEDEAARLFDDVARVAGFPETQLNFPRAAA